MAERQLLYLPVPEEEKAGPAVARAPKRFYRLCIEGISPEIDSGRYAVKRTVGEWVRVSADIFADGHDALAAAVLYRPLSWPVWREEPLTPAANDRWEGAFKIDQYEDYLYTFAAWVDSFSTWKTLIQKKAAAGQDLKSDLLEGVRLLKALAGRSEPGAGLWIEERLPLLSRADAAAAALEFIGSYELARYAAEFPDYRALSQYGKSLRVHVDRERARFSTWYEFFPRSVGTLRDAAARLPAVADLGFDVVYLPPVHPIGVTGRKAPNNRPGAGPADPGSPWAIGGAAGGHKAVSRELGTLEDFRFFVKQARSLGMEVALDLAFQCSPDHPYVREHPEWFHRRPDGSIHYAENPPKKYEDIYPLNFECEDWEGLWNELRTVVEFWITQGVLIFRVDNPHTKAFSFWEWLITEVHASHPDAVFLAEAFTRPKKMYRLAKLGFTQSYTYFTWRNTKNELTEYVGELTSPPVSDFFRPNFFTNTPDILHEYLQHGGRPAFIIRLVLAGAMSSNYGIYSGYELCENRAMPGTEEYQDSEKFQIRKRDWDAPGNINAEIRTMNRIRREHDVFRYTNNVTFCYVDHAEILAFLKYHPGASPFLIVVSLNPYQTCEATLHLPLELLGLGSDDAYRLSDLLNGGEYGWRGRCNYVRLDPWRPAHVFQIRRT